MKIWHVNVGNHAGRVDGVAVMSSALASGQAAAGHTVSLWVAAACEHHRAVTDTVGPEVTLELHESAAAACNVMLSALSDPLQRPDVVHLHSVFRPAHAVVATAARRRGIPVVQTPHAGLDPILLQRDRAKKSAYRWLIERRQLRQADAVVALQRLEVRDVRRFSNRWRLIDVVSNAVARSVLERPGWTPPATERPVAVMLSRYDVLQKGLDRMVDLAHHLPHVDFHIHGTQDKNDPERTARLVARAPANVRFLPPVYDEEKLRLLEERTSVFLMPSRAEGVSLALTEAMAIGVPCAVSSFIDRSLDVGKLGAALVMPDDAAAAARQLDELLNDADAMKRIGEQGRQFASECFDPDRVSCAYLKIYARVVARRAAGTGAGPIVLSDGHTQVDDDREGTELTTFGTS